MANCEFPKSFGQVSGTLSKQRIITPEGVVTRRVVAKVINGKQKIYLREDRPRATKVSEAEILNRRVFKVATAYWNNLTDYVRNVWRCNYKKSPERKKYKTLRGYVVASSMQFYKAHPELIEDAEKAFAQRAAGVDTQIPDIVVE